MNLRIKHLLILISACSFLFTGCSNDDENSEVDEIQTDADVSLLIGTWTINTLELEGEIYQVPALSPECGRDYFTYAEGGSYFDYVFYDGITCIPEESNLTWSINNGVIFLANNNGQSIEIPILELRSNKFVFKANLDANGDGIEEIYTVTAIPYNPPLPRDNYTNELNIAYGLDKIQLEWNSYDGINEFEKYEIYRNATNCSYTNAVKIATITEQEVDTFIDENPEVAEELCYFIRTYTTVETLPDSNISSILTNDIEVSEVAIASSNTNDSEITIQWEPYTGLFFSHYEVYVRNYPNNVTGYGTQEKLLATFDDINQTIFTDIDPPFLRDPIYEVRAVTIFDKSSGQYGSSGYEVNYRRAGLLDLSSFSLMAADENEPTLYFLGMLGNGDNFNILKHNYSTNESIVSDDPPNTSSAKFMQVVDSEFGKELLLLDGFDIAVFDANSLNLKYELVLDEGFISFEDFKYMGNGIWVVTDSEKLYTFSRNNAILSKIAEIDLSLNSQNRGNFQIVGLDNNRILVGHENDIESYSFIISSDGEINSENTIIGLEWKDYKKNLIYNRTSDKLLDIEDMDIYETENFTVINSFNQPLLATGWNGLGNTVFGTDNDPNWSIDDDSLHKKEAVFFNVINSSIEKKGTVGYPHIIFENNSGVIISISSWFKRENVNRSSLKPDLFIEVIEN